MHARLFLCILALAGCAGPAAPTNHTTTLQGAPEQEIAAEPLEWKAWTAAYNLSLVGSWHTLALDGHVLGELGHYNCVIVDVAGAGPLRLEATANWTAANALEEQISIAHVLKDENVPSHASGHTTGVSPLQYVAADLETHETTHLTAALLVPQELPAGFGTIEHIALNLTIHYAGHTAPATLDLSTCGSQYNKPV